MTVYALCQSSFHSRGGLVDDFDLIVKGQDNI